MLYIKRNDPMAAETYYFLFSNIAAMMGLVFIAKFISIRIRYNEFARKYKVGTAERARLDRFSSTRFIAGTAGITLLFMGNLAFDVHRLLHFADKSYAHGVLIFVPISCVVLFIIAYIYIYNMFGKDGEKLKKR